jgi:acyl-coenzyme A thioesterase PaaI-like protein
MTEASEGEGAPAPDPRLRAAAAIRRLTDLIVARPIDETALAGAADELEDLAGAVDGAAGPGRLQRVPPGRQARVRDFLPSSPVIGEFNPLSPPAEVWSVTLDDGRRELRGRVRFGPAYEGPPGFVHGGVIAMLCDEMLGAANMMAGRPGITGTLTVRYRKPTPLESDLDLEARLVGQQGRKLRTWGGVSCEGILLAEVDGLFIGMRAEHMLNVAGSPEAAPPG